MADASLLPAGIVSGVSGFLNGNTQPRNNSFNPMSLLGLIGSGVSALGNLWSNNQQKQLAEQNMKQQWQMMLANQNFNRQEAMAARNWQEKMVASYRQYNDPSEQMRRFEEAGLNPALMYGSIQDTNTSPSGNPQASSNGSYSPVGMPLNNFGDTAMQMAQIDVLKSQAQKNRADAGLSVAHEDTENQMRDGLVKTQNSIWQLNEVTRQGHETNNAILAKQLDNFDLTIDSLKTAIKEANARIANLESKTVGQDIDNVYKSSWWNESIRKISSEADLNVETTRKIVLLMALEAANIQADTSTKLTQGLLNGKLGSYYDSMKVSNDAYRVDIIPRLKTQMILQNNTLHFDLGQAKKFNTAERIVRMASDATGAAGSLLFGGAQMSKLLPRSVPSIGFR